MKQLILPLEGLSDEAIEGIIDDACQHGANRDDIRLVDGLVTVSKYSITEDLEGLIECQICKHRYSPDDFCTGYSNTCGKFELNKLAP